MTCRVVIVGPGRVGAAFGRRLHEAGWSVLGFVGRDRERALAAARFAGIGEVLSAADHIGAEVVVFAVGDVDLAAAIATCRQAGEPRGGSLWLHTSGCHDLTVFGDLAAAGAMPGSLHPVAPFADAETGYRAMVGQPAVIDGTPAAVPRLEELATALGMVGLCAPGMNRALYHAACALAANGLVVLRGLVDDTFAAAGGLRAGDARVLADALMQVAVASTGEHGATAALSGPVRRGDATTVRRHLQAIGAEVPHAVGAYRALMFGALRLARAAGLSTAAAATVASVLAADEGEG